MARKRRVTVAHGVYHVIQRGNNRAFVFQETKDKRTFLSFLQEVKEKLPYYLLYYVLMDNHYHLLIETMEEPIGRIMHRINMYYALYYNKTYGRSGTIFGGRYSATLVTEQAYFLQLIRYQAMNPVKAGMVKAPEDYPFSGHQRIMAKRAEPLDRQRFFGYLDDRPVQAKKKYLTLLAHPAEPVEGILVDPDQRADYRQKQLKRLLEDLTPVKKIRTQVLSKSREKKVVHFRRQLVHRACEKGFSVKEIARFLSITPRAVRYLQELRPP